MKTNNNKLIYAAASVLILGLVGCSSDKMSGQRKTGNAAWKVEELQLKRVNGEVMNLQYVANSTIPLNLGDAIAFSASSTGQRASRVQVSSNCFSGEKNEPLHTVTKANASSISIYEMLPSQVLHNFLIGRTLAYKCDFNLTFVSAKNDVHEIELKSLPLEQTPKGLPVFAGIEQVEFLYKDSAVVAHSAALDVSPSQLADYQVQTYAKDVAKMQLLCKNSSALYPKSDAAIALNRFTLKPHSEEDNVMPLMNPDQCIAFGLANDSRVVSFSRTLSYWNDASYIKVEAVQLPKNWARIQKNISLGSFGLRNESTQAVRVSLDSSYLVDLNIYYSNGRSVLTLNRTLPATFTTKKSRSLVEKDGVTYINIAPLASVVIDVETIDIGTKCALPPTRDGRGLLGAQYKTSTPLFLKVQLLQMNNKKKLQPSLYKDAIFLTTSFDLYGHAQGSADISGPPAKAKPSSLKCDKY